MVDLFIDKSSYSPSLKTKGRGKVYNNFSEAIGDTPLVKLNRFLEGKNIKAEIYAKLEFFNPLSSVKDRLAYGMIEAAEQEGKIKPGTVLVEPTSGNTGIALAFICAAKNYSLILTMPESMSVERRKILSFLGAELHLTPASQGMKGAITKAEEITSSNPNAVMLQQFKNIANPVIHSVTTAEEIWNDTNGEVDVFIAGVGTGGTITGVGEALKKKKESIKIIAVEPEDSAVMSGKGPGPHKIQGIGAGFIPDVLNVDIIDEIVTVSNAESFSTSRDLATSEGIPGGISSGATVAAALKVAARSDMAGKKIVVVLASCAERYISTALFDSINY